MPGLGSSYFESNPAEPTPARWEARHPLPYSADGAPCSGDCASAAGGGRGDRRHYAETTLSSRAQRLSCCHTTAARKPLGPLPAQVFSCLRGVLRDMASTLIIARARSQLLRTTCIRMRASACPRSKTTRHTAVPKKTHCDQLCGPRAFRPNSTRVCFGEASGALFALHFRPAWWADA